MSARRAHRIPASAGIQGRWGRCLRFWVPAFAGTRSREREHGFESSWRSAQQGFTLIEMMVALAVFSLAALALIRLEGASFRGAATLDRVTMANIVARNVAVDALTDAKPPAAATTAPSRSCSRTR